LSGAGVSTGLSVICGLAAVAAVGVYIRVMLRQRRWMNSVGLLFTGLGVGQLSLMLPATAGAGPLIHAALMVALFLAALVAQVVAALRGRAAWDGQERRESP
jgi:hypothetical protein